jgi:hypothetical protein
MGNDLLLFLSFISLAPPLFFIYVLKRFYDYLCDYSPESKEIK